MNDELYPLYVLPATFSAEKNAIRFRRLDGSFLDSRKQQDLVWKILETATGRLTQSELTSRLQEAFPDIEHATIEAALQQLLSAGVLVDNIAAFDIFHQYSNNPLRFSRRMSAKEISQNAKTPRLSVKKGATTSVSPLRKSTLAKLQTERRTTRAFDETPVTLKELGHILTSGYSLPLHSTPSAGALYPLKIYAIVMKASKSLAAGYYEYNPETHELVLFDEHIDTRRIAYSFNNEQLLGSAPVIIIVAADMKRNQRKYSNRGYRLLLLEAGQALQNMQLAATEQHLGCFEYAGFQDEGVSDLMTMNKLGERRVIPLITMAIGTPSRTPSVQQDRGGVIEKLRHELIGEGKPFDTTGLVDLKNIWLRHTFIRALRDDGTFLYGAGGTSESSEIASLKAFAEAYERHVSSEVRVDREATPAQLTKEGAKWLDPRVVAPLTADHFGTAGPMEAFTDTALVQWVKGKTVKGDSDVWVPIDLVYYPLHPERWKRKAFSWSSSSGVAAFTDKTTATQKAFLELLERHCLMTLWHSRRQPQVIPTRLLPIHWKKQVEYWATKGRNVHVLDISSGFGEVTLKVIIESDTTYPHYTNGAASSLVSFEEALEKAFQEAQVATETIPHRAPETSLSANEVRSVTNHGEFYADADHREKISWVWHGTKARTVPQPKATIKELLNQFDPVVIELSPPNAPLYVVRVICEKLVPIGFGFGNTHHLHNAITDVHPDSLNLPHDFA